MKKVLAISSCIEFIVSIFLLGLGIFTPIKVFYILSLIVFLIFIISIIILLIKSPNDFSKKASIIYKNNKKLIKPIILNQLNKHPLKVSVRINKINNEYYMENNKLNINFDDSISLDEERELLFYLVNKICDDLLYSRSLKSLINYIRKNTLLIKKNYRSIEIVDFEFNCDKGLFKKYIKNNKFNLQVNWNFRNK